MKTRYAIKFTTMACISDMPYMYGMISMAACKP
jgi:hypothetical protein